MRLTYGAKPNRQLLMQFGFVLPDPLPMRREVFVASSKEEALRLCGPSLALKYKTYHQWGQSKPMPEGDNDLGQELNELMKGRFFIGSPDEVADDIIAICRPTGINHIVISTHWPGMENEVALDSMRMFAEEVIPNLRDMWPEYADDDRFWIHPIDHAPRSGADAIGETL